MRADALSEVLRRQPFEPIELGLSDGRVVLIRHPDQAILARRHLILGLAQVKQGRNQLSTPPSGDVIVKDWMLVDLTHVVSAEPANGHPQPRKAKRPR